jgi:rhodanese-related sulfurtransferase
MKTILIIMSIFSFLTGGNTAQKDTIKILDTPSFKLAISTKKVQLVDVRTPNEYKGEHIQKAINIDFFNQKNFIHSFNKLNKEEAVYLYCRSGNRSQKAAQKLDSLGFTKIFDLKDGYINWRK